MTDKKSKLEESNALGAANIKFPVYDENNPPKPQVFNVKQDTKK